MPYTRLCPNCLTGEIKRPDQQTCCPQCSMEWRALGPDRRKERIRKASQPLIDLSELVKGQPSNDDDSNDNDEAKEEEFSSDKIFGILGGETKKD